MQTASSPLVGFRHLNWTNCTRKLNLAHTMEHKLVALLMVTIALAGGVAGSVLHGPGLPVQHLIPYEVTYPNAQSPVLLSQPLGLTVDQLLAAAGYSPSPAPVAEVAVEGNSSNESINGGESGEALNNQQLSQSTSGVSITNEDVTAQLLSSGYPLATQIAIDKAAAQLSAAGSLQAVGITIEEAAAQLSASGLLQAAGLTVEDATAQLSASGSLQAAGIAAGDASPQLSEPGSPQPTPAALGEVAPSSTASESPLLTNEIAPPSAAPEPQSLTIETRLSAPESSLPPATSDDKLASLAIAPESPSLAADSLLSVSPLPAAKAEDALLPTPDSKLLDSITRGSFYIDSAGKVQMQATYTSGGEELSVVATDLPQAVASSVPVVVPELPVVAVAEPVKPHGVSNVNVNVNVNVNGDGTGSSFNATSVSKINSPIEVKSKCH